MPNGIEDGFESSVVFSFERVELAGERFIRGEHPAKPDERSHDGDVDLNRTGLLRTLDSMATPSWVNAYGRYFRCFPRPRSKITICDLKDAASALVS